MKINIHISTYIFLLISFLSGYFEYMYLFLLSIIVHECGHVLFGIFVGYKDSIINIYPFGGITIFDADLNTKIYKELITLFGGVFIELLFVISVFYMYKYNYVTYHVFYVLKKINFILISFNFLPILPLDGGKLINLILDIFLPYKMSNKVSIFISIIFIFIFLFNNISIFRILLALFLIKSIIFEIKNINIKYNWFLFERYINNYNFKKINFINNKNLFKRDYIHFINYVYEKEYLRKLFDKSNKNMLKY